MPEDAGDKTEPPTPRRRQESRAQGQVAKSQDLSAAVLLLVGLLLLTLFGPHLWRTMLAVTRSALGEGGTANIEVVLVFGSSALVETAKALAPVFAITFLVAGLVLYAQIGGIFTWQPLMPKLSKLNPINGFKRIFSPNTLVMLGQNLLKLAAVALEQHPLLLAQWSQEGIFVPDEISIAIAVDTEAGLTAPVIRDVPSNTHFNLKWRVRDRGRRRRSSSGLDRGRRFARRSWRPLRAHRNRRSCGCSSSGS